MSRRLKRFIYKTIDLLEFLFISGVGTQLKNPENSIEIQNVPFKALPIFPLGDHLSVATLFRSLSLCLRLELCHVFETSFFISV